MSQGLVRIGALAEQVDLSVSWLRQLADTGEIPSERSPGGHRRFDVAAVRDALARRQLSTRRALTAQPEPSEAPDWTGRFPLAGLAEDEVWRTVVSELDLDRTAPAGRIMTYAFTEMLNNAIDHSDGTYADVAVWRSAERIAFRITYAETVFKAFTIDHEFARTRPVVKLFGLGLTFVSRSEARRLLDGLEEFTEVEIDFTGVTDVGQGFVDELLRVWPSLHPGKRVVPVNMSEAVEFMVKRGLPGPSTGKPTTAEPPEPA